MNTPASIHCRAPLAKKISTATSPFRGREYESPIDQRQVSLATLFRSKLFWMFVAIFLPTIICGVHMNMDEISQKFYLAPNQENIFYLRNTWEQTVSFARFLVKEFTPRGDLVEQIKNKSEDISERTTSYIKDLYDDYKPDFSDISSILTFFRLFLAVFSL